MRVYCREEVIESDSEGLFLLGKAEEKLPLLAKAYAGKVGLVYLDPPSYGIYTEKTGSEYSEADYLKVMKQVLVSCRSMLSNTGTLILHLCSGSHAKIRLLLEEIMGNKNYVNEVVWQYKTRGKSTKCFSHAYDTLLIYKKRSKQYINLAEIAGLRGAARTNHWRKIVDDSGRIGYTANIKGKTVSVYEGDPVYLTDVWNDIDRLNANSPEKTGYPEQKPEALLSRLIKAFTQPNDYVLDPFMGSGTSAVCSMKLGRRFIGMDSSPFSLNTVRQRLFQLRENPSLLESNQCSLRFLFPALRIKFTSECEVIQKAGKRTLIIRSVTFNGESVSLLSAASGERKGDIFYPLNNVACSKFPVKLPLPQGEEVTVRLTSSSGQYIYLTV